MLILLEGVISHSYSTLMKRLGDCRHLCQMWWETAEKTWLNSSTRKCNVKKGIYTFSSASSFYLFQRVPHFLALHDSSPFTAECFILPQLSLVVWQKNWKSTDYVYFQNRAYQSVIRLLWCSLLIFATNDPCNICPFPPDMLFSIKALPFWYCLRPLCVCMCVRACVHVWSSVQIIWMTLWNNNTIWGQKYILFLSSKQKNNSLNCCIYFYHFCHVAPILSVPGINMWSISAYIIWVKTSHQ